MREIFEKINLEAILPENKRNCPICNSSNTEICEQDDFISCLDCEGVSEYWKCIFHNFKISGENEKIKLIEKIYFDYVQTRLRETELLLNEIDFSTVEEIELILEIHEKIHNMPDKSMLIIEAPTGVGKTHNLVLAALDEVKLGNKISFICSTKNEIKKAMKLFINLGGENIKDKIDVVTKDNSQIRSRKEFKEIIITTYAYLSTKGHSKEFYKIAKHLLNERCVFADEIQAIEEYSSVIIPLGGRYIKNDDNMLYHTHKCPKAINQGKCENCYHFPILKKNKFQEYKCIPEIFFESEKDKLDIYQGHDLFKPKFYDGNSIYNVISARIYDIEEFKHYLNGFTDIADNIDMLENLELKMQLVFEKLENEEIKFLRKNDIIEKLEESENGEKTE